MEIIVKGKFIENIVKINHVLFFLITCIVLSIFLTKFISDLLRESYSEPKVELTNTNSDTAEQKDVRYNLSYLGLLKSFHLINVESNQIKLVQDQDSNVDMFNMFSGGGNDVVRVNIIFIGPENNQRKLLKQDAYIYESSIDNFKYLRSENKLLEIERYTYTVISSDTNKDGFLSTDDQKDFYVSDYNGLNLQLMVENIHSYELINKNMVLIKQIKNGTKVFNVLDLTSNEITELEVDLN